MVKNIIIVMLSFFCVTLAVYSFIQASIAKQYEEQARKCQKEVQLAREKIELQERELANRNNELASALEEAHAARMKALEKRK